MDSEKILEAGLVLAVGRIGGLCIKLLGQQFTGLPDRMCLLPGGRIVFVEVKSTGKKLRPRQEYVKKQLEKLGFQYHIIDTEEKLQNFINAI